jgi:mutator protein MutT
MTALKERFKVVPAVYIIFRDGEKILLLRRFQTGYRDGEYSLPSGHVDGGEPATQAAVRETKEEVGVDIAPGDLRLVHTMHRKSADPEPHERIDLYFEVAKWRGELRNAEPHKCDELRWANPDDLPKNMIPEVRQALVMIAKHEPYSDFNF